MNLALLLQFGFSASLQKLVRWLPERKAKHACAASTVPPEPAASVVPPTALCCAAPPQHSADLLLAVHRPLRVVHVLEAGQPRSHVGRMVISGCMADVCAELDRLVAREAALS